MSFPDKPREPSATRRARPRLSLKMQAIGFLSRREHSRQELRAKLLEVLRKRAREEAALATAAEELARAAQAQPSNGIDDAFAPRAPEAPPAPAHASARQRASRAGALEEAFVRAREQGQGQGQGQGQDGACTPGTRIAARTQRAALDTLTRADGRALPSSLRARLMAAADADPAPVHAMPEGATSEASPEDDLERTDPEAAVERLLDWLVAHKYLSDTRFVESRVNARSRKQGTLRIKLELSRHGLTMAPEQAATLRETEFARAQALWQRKFGELASDPRERAKQARFLASRGFAADVVRRIVGGRDED